MMDEDQEIEMQIESLALLLEERGEKDAYRAAKEMVERARQAASDRDR